MAWRLNKRLLLILYDEREKLLSIDFCYMLIFHMLKYKVKKNDEKLSNLKKNHFYNVEYTISDCGLSDVLLGTRLGGQGFAGKYNGMASLNKFFFYR